MVVVVVVGAVPVAVRTYRPPDLGSVSAQKQSFPPVGVQPWRFIITGSLLVSQAWQEHWHVSGFFQVFLFLFTDERCTVLGSIYLTALSPVRGAQ
jgi:hypothetical protein